MTRASFKIVLIITFLACLVPAITGLSLAQNRPPTSAEFLISLALTVFSFGAVILFIMGLGNFKHTVRRAYGLLSAGIALYGIGQLSLALVDFFPPLVDYIAIPYILSITFMFLGMRRLAKLVQLRSFWMSLIAALVVSSAVAFLVTLLPHTPNSQEEMVFDITNAMSTWSCVMLLFTTLVAWEIRSAIAANYRTSLSWMIAGFVALATSGALFVTTGLVLPVDSWYFDTGLQLTPALMSSMFFMWAGYCFTRVNAESEEGATTATPVDVIVYVVGLVSVPKDVDEQLDVLRTVTSQQGKQASKLTSTQ